MKEKILSVVLLVIIIAFVTVNTIILSKQIDEIIEKVEGLDTSENNANENAEQIYENFMKKQKYMSLTVSHDDMTSIEGCFVEMIGYLAIGDHQNAEVVKYRLKNSLEHLRRLSGFNLDAII